MTEQSWRDDPRTIVERCLLFGLAPADQIEAAILAGSHAVAVAETLATRSRKLRAVLIIPSLGHMPADPASQIREAHFTMVSALSDCSGATYLHDFALELIDFLLDFAPAPDRLFVYLDDAAPSVRTALDDLLWSSSERFFTNPPSFDRPQQQRLRAWADYLFQHQRYFHAYRFYHFLRASLPPTLLAPSALKCLLQMECFDPIADWVPHLSASSEERRNIQTDVDQSLRDCQRKHEATWQENLSALAPTHPALHARLLSWQPTRRLLGAVSDEPWLFQLGTPPPLLPASYTFLFHEDGAHLRLANPLPNPRSQRQLFEVRDAFHSVLIPSLKPYATLLNTVIHAPLLSAYYCYTEIQQAIFVVERDFDYFAELLFYVKLAHLLEQRRIFFFVGPQALDEFAEQLRAQPMLLIPPYCFGSDPEAEQLLQRIRGERMVHAEELAQSLEVLGDDRFNRELPALLSGHASRKLRVWMKVMDFDQFLPIHMRDVQRGWEEAGAEVFLFHEGAGWERASPEAELQTIVSFRPDLIFLNDHLRPNLAYPVPPQIPVVCWFQDNEPHLRDPAIVRQLGPRDFTFCTTPDFVTLCDRLGYPHARLLAMGANPALHRPRPELPPPADEVAFINQMVPRTDEHGYPGLTAFLYRVLAERGVTLQDPERLQQLVREGTAQLGLHVAEEHRDALLQHAILIERQVYYQEVVRWLIAADVPLALYGRDWDRWPEFARFARGEVRQGEPAACTYPRSKVLMHVNTNMNLHQRVFEGIASGAFLAVRSLPSDGISGGLADHFRLGQELTLFSSREELLDLVGRAFRDEAWRQQRIWAGRQRVLAEHTYAARMRTILSEIVRAIAP